MPKKGILKFPQMQPVEFIEQDGFLFQWCCGCHLRHIWHFHIIRGKNPVDDIVVISGNADRVATALRKSYDKNNNNKRKQ